MRPSVIQESVMQATPKETRVSRSRPAIYLDHSATTPLRDEALAAMQPYFAEFYGNPSSIHWAGRRGHAGLDQARRTVAGILGAKPTEIVFTASGTESDNAALRGIARTRRKQNGANRVVVSPTEHAAIQRTAEDLHDNYGFELTLLPVDGEGRVNPADVAGALGEDVALVSVLYANNEVGTIQPIAVIGALCKAAGVPFHTDAVQAAGKLPLNVNDLCVDSLSLSGHKFYGPKGAGVFYLRQGTPYQPLVTGGSQEGGRRAATENVPSLVGLATALALAEAEREGEMARLQVLRDRLIGGILESVEGARLTGSPNHRLSSHASFVLAGLEAEGVLIGLDMVGIAASSGSACSNASQRPSHVLEAMGVSPADLYGGLRLTLGRSNTPEQMDFVVQQLARIVANIRSG
jgi:cysteine desulfurase